MPSPSEIRAGAAYVELYARSSPLVRGLKAGEKMLHAWGRKVQQLGQVTMAAGMAVVGPILAAATRFAYAGDALDKMSKRTGVSVEMLSALSSAASIGGADIADLEKGVKRMHKVALDSERGLTAAKDTLADLGISARDTNGQLKDSETLLLEGLRAMSRMENHTKKAALAQELFGRSGEMMLPMLHEGEAGLLAVMEKAQKFGLILTEEDATAAAKLTDAMTWMRKVFDMLVIRVGGAVAPMLTDMAERIAEVSSRAIAWIKANQPLIVMLLKFGAGLVAAGAALYAIAPLLMAAGAGMGLLSSTIIVGGAAVGILGTVLAALLSPLGLVTAGVIGLGTYWAYTTGQFSKTSTWLGEVFNTLRADAVGAFGAMKDALSAGDWQAAAAVLWALLRLEWTRGVNWLEAEWVAFKDRFLGIWTDTVYGLAAVFADGIGLWRKSLSGFTVWAQKSMWDLALGMQQAMYNAMPDWLAKSMGIDKGTGGMAAAAARGAMGAYWDVEGEKQAGEIDEKQAGWKATIEEDRLRAHKARADRYGSQLEENERELARAEEALESAKAAARRARTEGPAAPDIRDRYDEIVDGALGSRAAIAGTFSADALKYLAGPTGDAQERTAKATEESAERLGRIDRNLQANKLVWVSEAVA